MWQNADMQQAENKFIYLRKYGWKPKEEDKKKRKLNEINQIIIFSFGNHT